MAPTLSCSCIIRNSSQADASLELAGKRHSQSLHEQASVPVGLGSGLNVHSTSGNHLNTITRTVSTSRRT